MKTIVRFSRISLLCLCLLALASMGLVRTHPLAAANADTATPTSPTTGTVVVTFNLTFRSSIPSSDVIGCEVTLNVQGDTTSFREVAARQGTRSGGTGRCSVPVPYSWLLQRPGTDTINLNYEVVVPPEALNLGTVSFPYRDSSQSGTITPVPTSGTQTNITLDVTL